MCSFGSLHKEQNYLIVKTKIIFSSEQITRIFNLILNSDPDEVIKIERGEGLSDELEIFAGTASSVCRKKSLPSWENL